MEVIDYGGWRFFHNEKAAFDDNKVGKWMYFFSGREGRDFAEKKCKEAVETSIVGEAKRSDSTDTGVACFYINIDDLEGHKRIISFFIKNQMIRRTKTGKLYDISFKLDNQTMAGKYGSDFTASLKLSQLLDLKTEEWKY